MTPEEVKFPLAPLYKKHKIDFKQAKVVFFHPEGSSEHQRPFVRIEKSRDEQGNTLEDVEYNFLINATGPKLAFDLTPGLKPGTNKCYSVCTYDHAEHASAAFTNLKLKLKKSDHNLKVLIGTGHAKATCQGAAFEYILNVDSELRRCNLRDKAEITWISNEYTLGDFGMDGILMKFAGQEVGSSDMVEMVFKDRGIKWILGARVQGVEDGVVHYETLEGEVKSETYDFAMLIPAFSGHGFKAYDKNGADITEKLFKGFMIVDADYTSKPYEQWSVQDWPETYQNPFSLLLTLIINKL